MLVWMRYICSDYKEYIVYLDLEYTEFIQNVPRN